MEPLSETPLRPKKRSLCGACDRLGQVTSQVCSLEEDPSKEYCVACLHIATANNKVEMVKLSDLTPLFSDIQWDGSKAEDICQSNSGQHWQRILRADFGIPILVVVVSANPDGTVKKEIIDGLHRVAKAHIERQLLIACKYVSQEQLDQCVFDPEAMLDNDYPPASFRPQHAKWVTLFGVCYMIIFIGGVILILAILRAKGYSL